MITLDDIRRLTLALPETEERTHYRLPAFQVNGKTFVVVKPGKAQALLHVDEPDGRAAIAEAPTVFEEERPGRAWGVWADLASVTPERLERLIELAWRAKAPKRLVDVYDGNR
ncbi:MmcQ/YjbR family DNA-binding protein [Micromonospora sp. NPDC000668]|uniref:MmcQ/YjbR family DNA-binding protein n=1 Tax=Micromonospora sp. NPDC000668 TaxID=3364219 RepID=UPI0036BB8F5E